MDNAVIVNSLGALATMAMGFAAWRAYWSYQYFRRCLRARERAASLVKSVLAADDASDVSKEFAGLLLALLCSREGMRRLVHLSRTVKRSPLDRKFPDMGKYEETLQSALNYFSLAALLEDRHMAPKLYRLLRKQEKDAKAQKSAANAQKKIKEISSREAVVVKDVLIGTMKIPSSHRTAHPMPA